MKAHNNFVHLHAKREQKLFVNAPYLVDYRAGASGPAGPALAGPIFVPKRGVSAQPHPLIIMHVALQLPVQLY